MSTGKRIRAVRNESGQSQTSFASECSVSLRTLKAYELDERDPPSSLLLHLYLEREISPTWLLSGDGPKSVQSHKLNVSNAVVAVRTFVKLKAIDFSPEKEAKLVLLLSEYFDEGGKYDDSFVQSMLESSL